MGSLAQVLCPQSCSRRVCSYRYPATLVLCRKLECVLIFAAP
jgi:hypothetical protein